MIEAPKLEAVYYPYPIPRSNSSLTIMGLVFDKVYFPNVVMPPSGYNPNDVAKERNRIVTALNGRIDYDTAVLLSMLDFLGHVETLKGFCEFSGDENTFSYCGSNKELGGLAKEIEKLVYGPPPENFYPITTSVHSKGLPGGERSICYPSLTHYPAGSLIFSRQRSIPLITDEPRLPVPGTLTSPKENINLLASIMAIECFSVNLPHVRLMNPLQLMQFRNDNEAYLLQFRASLLRLASKLQSQIGEGISAAEVAAAAARLVETEVNPQLLELQAAVNRSNVNVWNIVTDAGKQIPNIAASFAVGATLGPVPGALSAVLGILGQMQSARESKKKELEKHNFYYLLRATKE